MQDRFDAHISPVLLQSKKIYNIFFYLHVRMNKHDLKFNNNLVSQVWSDVSVLSLSF